MGTGPITKAREVEHGGVRRAVATAKPTINFSPLDQTTSVLADTMKLHGKLFDAYAKNVASLGDSLLGVFKEYQKYEDRLAELAHLKRMSAEEAEANVCRTADGKPVIDPGDVCTRHDHDPFKGIDEGSTAEGDGRTPYERRQAEAEVEAKRRREEEEEKEQKGGL